MKREEGRGKRVKLYEDCVSVFLGIYFLFLSATFSCFVLFCIVRILWICVFDGWNLITYHTNCIKLSTSIAIRIYPFYCICCSLFIGSLCIIYTETVGFRISRHTPSHFEYISTWKNSDSSLEINCKLYGKIDENNSEWKSLRIANNQLNGFGEKKFRILSIKKNVAVIFKWYSIDKCNWTTNFYAYLPYQIHRSTIIISLDQTLSQHLMLSMKLEDINFCATVNCYWYSISSELAIEFDCYFCEFRKFVCLNLKEMIESAAHR